MDIGLLPQTEMVMQRFLFLLLMCASVALDAAEVEVSFVCGIDDSPIGESIKCETEVEISTPPAPEVDGFIFTGWTSSRPESFTARNRLGRALESARQVVYGETVLTANYLASGTDADGDGVADGWERYWYGDLDETAESDTDGDSFNFAAEIAAGTDPLMVDRSPLGGIVRGSGASLQYNPDGLPSYRVRSNPESALFNSYEVFVNSGIEVSIPACAAAGFAYWTTNGVRVADRHGRALDAFSFTMGARPIDIVACEETDAGLRSALYWYGREMSPESDSDGDGYTFAQELAAGTDPLMADRSPPGRHRQGGRCYCSL